MMDATQLAIEHRVAESSNRQRARRKRVSGDHQVMSF